MGQRVGGELEGNINQRGGRIIRGKLARIGEVLALPLYPANRLVKSFISAALEITQLSTIGSRPLLMYTESPAIGSL